MGQLESLSDINLLRAIFDQIPAMLLLVDQDVRIHHLNTTAAKGLGLDLDAVRNKRGGEVLHCIHALEHPEGCGRSPSCRDCVVRNAVRLASQGETTFRQVTRLTLVNGGQPADIHLLISANRIDWPGASTILLTLENVSELIRLRSLLPICMHCKKIRDDEGYWNEVADYLSKRLDVDFSHGLCPECLREHFPSYKQTSHPHD